MRTQNSDYNIWTVTLEALLKVTSLFSQRAISRHMPASGDWPVYSFTGRNTMSRSELRGVNLSYQESQWAFAKIISWFKLYGPLVYAASHVTFSEIGWLWLVTRE